MRSKIWVMIVILVTHVIRLSLWCYYKKKKNWKQLKYSIYSSVYSQLKMITSLFLNIFFVIFSPSPLDLVTKKNTWHS